MKGSSGNEGSDKKVPTNEITSAKEMIGQHQQRHQQQQQ